MSIHYCPVCNQRYTVGFDCTDFVHNCGEQVGVSDAIKQEDVVVVGDWEDFSGSGTKTPQEVLMQGMENELQGRRAGIEGERKQAITRRGARATTHRQRNKLTYIDLKNDKRN